MRPLKAMRAFSHASATKISRASTSLPVAASKRPREIASVWRVSSPFMYET